MFDYTFMLKTILIIILSELLTGYGYVPKHAG